MPLVTWLMSKTWIFYEVTGRMPALYSRLCPLPPPFSFKFWQRVRPLPDWVTRRDASYPSSVLSQAFGQSNFAIRVLAICPHILAGCVLWSWPETQLCSSPKPPSEAGWEVGEFVDVIKYKSIQSFLLFPAKMAAKIDFCKARENGSENRFLSRVRSAAKRECES